MIEREVPRTPGERLENSPILTVVIAALMFAFLWIQLHEKRSWRRTGSEQLQLYFPRPRTAAARPAAGRSCMRWRNPFPLPREC